MTNSISSICIVGGGSAGWMAASLLSTVLQSAGIKVTLVESPDIATVGVGESTVPSIMDFLRASQIDMQDFVTATSASFKLGIRFDGWGDRGGSFFHPFGRIGQELNGFEFYQVWLSSLNNGVSKTELLDHSPGAVMAMQQRFMLKPKGSDDWALSSYSYALHLDAIAAARYLREQSLARGVNRIEANVERVNVDTEGFLSELCLDDGQIVESDFFIDCTGFKALLIQEALGVGYECWSDYLPCDRAVTVQTQSASQPVPYTIAKAQNSGWSWKIPLQHRTGNGYVFSSEYCSDEEAASTLLATVEGDLVSEPRFIPFVTGKREKLWHKNCLSLGLASGFLEPLESTAIHLVYKTLVHFIKHFPDSGFDLCNESEFNKKIDKDYLEIRDFIILHYYTAQRSNSEFWRQCKNMNIPKSLHDKMDVFLYRGELDHKPGQFFTEDSWISILEGMKIRPRKHHPLLNGFDQQRLASMLLANKVGIKETVEKIPFHHEFIRQHCAAKLG